MLQYVASVTYNTTHCVVGSSNVRKWCFYEQFCVSFGITTFRHDFSNLYRNKRTSVTYKSMDLRKYLSIDCHKTYIAKLVHLLNESIFAANIVNLDLMLEKSTFYELVHNIILATIGSNRKICLKK